MGNLFSSAPKEQETYHSKIDSTSRQQPYYEYDLDDGLRNRVETRKPVEERTYYPRVASTSRQPSYEYIFDVEDYVFKRVESRKPVEERTYPRVASTSGQATYRFDVEDYLFKRVEQAAYRYDYDNNRIAEPSSYYKAPQGGQSLTHLSSKKTRQITPWIKVQRNATVLNLSSDDYFNFSQVVTVIPLSETDPEYLRIKRMISKKHFFKIDSIEKIENPYLKKAYELKKAEKTQRGLYFEECLLFHGTKQEYVDSICKFNFNWRLVKRNKFGIGVSFSTKNTYALNYSDKRSYNKVMIVAKVLVGHTCPGHESMVLPVEGCDASTKGGDDVVIVKYDDNEFCPVYKINYHLVSRRNY